MNYEHTYDITELFPIATHEEMIAARKDLGWPTWETELKKQVNTEDYEA